MHRSLVGLFLCGWLLAGCMGTAPVVTQTPAVAPNATPIAPTPADPVDESPALPGSDTPPLPSPAPADSSPLFPGLDLALDASLPDKPEVAHLYRLSIPSAVDQDTAEELASGLGVEGVVYTEPGGRRSTLVWTGERLLRFFQPAPFFDLFHQSHLLLQPPSCDPPCLSQDTAGRLETDLQSNSLLDFEYRLQTSPTIGSAAEIIQLLEGAPLIAPDGPAAMAQFDANGEMAWLRYRQTPLEPARNTALQSAQQAWQALLKGEIGVVFNEYPSGSSQARSWTRRYPAGADLSIFGYAQVYEPAQAAGEALILLNDYPVTGAIQGLAQAAAGGRLIQAWGQVTEDPQNGLRLELSGWQASVFPEQMVEGRLRREGNAVYLVAEAAAGETHYRLPDAPADLPTDEAWVTARGVLPDAPTPTLEWYSLTEGPAQRVRAGGPGFRPVSLDAQDTSTPPTPVAGRVDGAVGVPQIIVHAYSDGSSQVEVQFVFATGDEVNSPAWARLDGAGLQGIEAYQNVPIRIWGQVIEASGGTATIEVERFEQQHPDVHIEAWLGMPEKATALGKEVWLLTTPAGESFVLGSTADGDAPPVEPALLRDPIIVEGIQYPDQALLDFPIIHDLLILPGVGRNGLDDYQPLSAQPRILHEPGAAGSRRMARIDSVELVYVLTTEAGQLAQTLQTASMAQPVWRFSGRFEDGAYFEIYVQALLEV